MNRVLGGLVAATAAALALAAPAAAQEPLRGVLVQWAPGADRDDRLDARAEADVAFDRGLGQAGLQRLEVEPGQTASAAAAELRTDDAVLVAEPDRPNYPQALPNDPLLGELWGLRNLGVGIDGFLGALAGADIDVERAWNRTVGSPSTVVAVIDSGYRFNHPDLDSVAWTNGDEIASNGLDDDSNGRVDDTRGYDFVGQNAASPSPDNDPTDADLLTGGHGVHVAGTIGAAGNDGAGITGVGQDLRIMPLRVCSHVQDSDPGVSSCPDSALVEAIDYAGQNGAQVANLSLGRAGSPSQLVIDAFARNPGTLYVISAGNDGANNDGGGSPPLGHHYPCDHNPATQSSVPGRIDNIVCVAATDQADQLADFSDYGSTSVDIGAPGTEVLSSYPKSDRFVETFTASDFATRWTATGANGGFARSNEAPLTSFGMTDTPGATATANTVRQSTSTGFNVPAGVGSCVFSQRRNLNVGGGNSYTYAVLLNDVAVFQSQAVTASGLISTVPITALNPGGTVKIRQTYTVGSSPAAGQGVWLDDLTLRCFEPLSSTAATYDYLQGTSMAAPHTAGVAGLMFSLKPTAGVTEVRNALLSSADPIPGLTGLVATGARLNAADALDVLVPPPAPPAQPSGPATPLPVVKCKVPKLAKLSLSKAKQALKKANCALGKVTKPKKRKGQKKLPPLVVKSSKPKAGTELAANSKVAVKLGPKPKKRKRR